MVLHHVPQRPRVLVITRSRADAFFLGDRNLDVIDVFVIEQWLEDHVRKPQDQDVLDRLLAEIVIDAVDLPFLEDLCDRVVDHLAVREIVADRFLDDMRANGRSSSGARTAPGQLLDGRAKQGRGSAR